MNKIKELLKNITLDKIAFLFLCLQPLLEIYYLYHFEGVRGIFTFSPATLIRLLLYFVLFIYFMIKHKIKDYKIPFIYGIVVLVYFAFHHIILKDFNYMNINNYSPIGELFYIFRMTLPILSIYVFYKSKYNEELLYKGVNIGTLIFVSIMIFTNIFMISLPSYYSPAYKIEDNIFGWIFASKNGYNYYQLATKGIFNFTNSLACSYVFVFILLLINLKKKNNKFNLVNIVLLVLSLYMLGSRVSSYFPLILLIATICISLFISLISKKKIDKKYLSKLAIITLITLIILPISPISQRSMNYEDNLTGYVDFEKLENQIADYKAQFDSGKYNKDEIVKFIRDNHREFLINKSYLDSYKVEDDLEFWINYYMIDKSIRGDNRLIQKSIIERIKEKTFETKNMLFGYTYTNTFNNGIFYEKDFFAQYFYLGILGVLILLCPYVFICLYVGIKSLINIKKLDFETTMLLLGVVTVLFISMLSGNSIEQFVVTIPLGIACGYMLKRVKEVY